MNDDDDDDGDGDDYGDKDDEHYDYDNNQYVDHRHRRCDWQVNGCSVQAVVEEMLALPPGSMSPVWQAADVPKGWTPLHFLLDGATRIPDATAARLRLAARLIEAGASVKDTNGEKGATAMHVAVGTGNVDGVQWLLSRRDGRADNRVGGNLN